jgi:hypothetical protein
MEVDAWGFLFNLASKQETHLHLYHEKPSQTNVLTPYLNCCHY